MMNNQGGAYFGQALHGEVKMKVLVRLHCGPFFGSIFRHISVDMVGLSRDGISNLRERKFNYVMWSWNTFGVRAPG